MNLYLGYVVSTFIGQNPKARVHVQYLIIYHLIYTPKTTIGQRRRHEEASFFATLTVLNEYLPTEG